MAKMRTLYIVVPSMTLFPTSFLCIFSLRWAAQVLELALFHGRGKPGIPGMGNSLAPPPTLLAFVIGEMNENVSPIGQFFPCWAELQY